MDYLSKYRARAVAKAYMQGDAYAVDFHNTLKAYVNGKVKKIWVNVARLERYRHLKIW